MKLFAIAALIALASWQSLASFNLLSSYRKSVLDFGAVGDGVTDNTAALSNAVKATLVYFPPGNYLTGPLSPTNGCLMFGDSSLTSKLILKSPESNTILVNCGSNAVVLRDLWLDGGTNDAFNIYPTPPAATTGLVHYAVGDGKVSGLRVTGFKTGIFINGTNSIAAYPQDAIYLGNTISNCQAGIYLSSSNRAEYVLIEGNAVKTVFWGLYNESAANITVVGNKFTGGQTGLLLQPAGGTRGHSLYSGNTVNHFVTSLYIYGTAWVTAVGNHFLGSTSVTLTFATNCFIASNSIELNGFNFSTGCISNIVSGNSFIRDSAPTVTGQPIDNKATVTGNFHKGVPCWSGLSGTATVTSGNTSVSVTHSLLATPTIQSLAVTPQNNLGNATKFWVSDVTTNAFLINVDVDPGATTAIFSWKHIQ